MSWFILHEFIAVYKLEVEIMYQNELLLAFFCKLENKILPDAWSISDITAANQNA